MQNVIVHPAYGWLRVGNVGIAVAIVADEQRIWLGICTEFCAPSGFSAMRSSSDRSRWGVWLAAGGIFVAPFMALLYRAEAGLIVMAAALGAASLLLHGARDAMSPGAWRWLRLLVAFNGLLMAACLVAAGWLAVRG